MGSGYGIAGLAVVGILSLAAAGCSADDGDSDGSAATGGGSSTGSGGSGTGTGGTVGSGGSGTVSEGCPQGEDDIDCATDCGGPDTQCDMDPCPTIDNSLPYGSPGSSSVVRTPAAQDMCACPSPRHFDIADMNDRMRLRFSVAPPYGLLELRLESLGGGPVYVCDQLPAPLQQCLISEPAAGPPRIISVIPIDDTAPPTNVLVEVVRGDETCP